MKKPTTYILYCGSKEKNNVFSIRDDGTVEYTVNGELKTCTNNKQLAQAFGLFIANYALAYAKEEHLEPIISFKKDN